jgi:acyl-coenzyme A synthetase/AMP-(fatty) acid ligase
MQYASLNEIVHERCKSDPNRLAYSFLDENLNVNEQWTYKDLFNKIILWCSALMVRKLNRPFWAS